jgi:DNA-binding transcriptional LysR family regulator
MFFMSNVSWDDQRVFLAVCDTGSLSAAARRLGVAQPTVRARIAALEQALGTVLFTRSVNGLAPTDHAHVLADTARAMERAASARPGEIAGAVRISVADFVGIEVMPPMLASLRAAYPAIAIELALSNATADLLEQEVDIAVRMHPPSQQALVARKIGAIPLGLFAHRDYLARKGVPSRIDDLQDHDMIGPDRALVELAMVEAFLPSLSRRNFVLRTDSHPAQFAHARAGLGIAIAHRKIGLADPALYAVLPDLDYPALETWIVMHEDLRRVPRVRAVFDHLVEAFTRYASEA